MSHPDTATLSEFADLARYKRSYVTQLKAAGRLVLTDDGKRVRVAESLQRIRDSADPSKAGVAARHAAVREAAAAQPVPAAEPDAALDLDDADSASGTYSEARARREHYQALSAKRDYEVSIGKLMDADQVCAAVASAATVLRTRLEALPDILGPQLAAETDETRIHAHLAETIEHALGEVARQFSALAKTEAA